VQFTCDDFVNLKYIRIDQYGKIASKLF